MLRDALISRNSSMLTASSRLPLSIARRRAQNSEIVIWGNSMKSGVRSALRVSMWSFVILAALAAVLALGALAVAQLWPSAHGARVQFGNNAIELNNIFSAGTIEFGIAWAAVTLAIIVGVLATLFALAVTSIALGIAATLTGLPLILVGLIVWFVLRSVRRSRVPGGATAPAL